MSVKISLHTTSVAVTTIPLIIVMLQGLGTVHLNISIDDPGNIIQIFFNINVTCFIKCSYFLDRQSKQE